MTQLRTNFCILRKIYLECMLRWLLIYLLLNFRKTFWFQIVLAYWRHMASYSLIKIKYHVQVFLLFSVKPLTMPMPTDCHLGHKEETLLKCLYICISFKIQAKSIQSTICKISLTWSKPKCVNWLPLIRQWPIVVRYKIQRNKPWTHWGRHFPDDIGKWIFLKWKYMNVD